ncbi:hypothetical protein K1719_027126 [Acacia pycnantha]|nr:hypothetical protein K1719_027126 [Acacia pycnantha]
MGLCAKNFQKRSAPKGGPKHGEKRRRMPKSKNVVGEETIVIPAPPPPVREVPTSTPAEASPIRETPTTGPVPTSSANSVPSSFSIPHSHDTMNGGALWSEEKIQWIEMERQAYKVASLIRPYTALRIQNALRLRSVNDLKQQISTLNSSLDLERKEKSELLSENHNLKSNADLPKVTAERDQAQQELEITRAEKEKARKDLAALNKRFVTAVEHIANAETNLSSAQTKLANIQAELKLAQLGLDAKQTELANAQAEVLRLSNICREDMLLKEKMISDNEHLAGVLKEKDDELATARMKIAKYSQIGRLSFENAVAQIRVLNPTVDLNTAGLHLQAYVSGKGRLIPPGGEDSDDESSSPTHSRV